MDTHISIGPSLLLRVQDVCILKLVQDNIVAITENGARYNAVFPSIAAAQKCFCTLVDTLKPAGFFSANAMKGPLFAGKRIGKVYNDEEFMGCCWGRLYHCTYVTFDGCSVYFRYVFETEDAALQNAAWFVTQVKQVKSVE
jgi:hypothetical protein